MVNMKTLKSGKMNQVEDAYDVGIGTQFSAETNKRDEDEEMMKYIEEQLTKRKSNRPDTDNDNDASYEEKYLSPEEAALMSLPEHLRVGSAHRSEEMLSNQMLNGIPEVDLGIESKIRNIEATEAAKEKLLMDQKNKKDAPSHFVPTNMAVNFVQHNRCTYQLFIFRFSVTMFSFECSCLRFQLTSTILSKDDDVNDNNRNVNSNSRTRTDNKDRLESRGQPMTIITINLRNNLDVIESIKYVTLLWF